MTLPAGCQVGRAALRKAGMVEDEFCARTRLMQLEFGDGIDAGRPAVVAPRLHDALIRHELDMASGDVAFEQGKCSAGLAADAGGRARHTELADLAEL